MRVLVHLLLIRPFLWLFFGINVEGRKNLAGTRQFIVVANHNSHLDVALIFSLLPVRQISRTHPVAAREYFERNRLLFMVVNFLFQPIWVKRGEGLGDPLGGVRARLDEGRNVVIFPEGTRGEPGHLADFKLGIGRLAQSHREVPVVPVFLSGPAKALPRGAAVPLPIWNEITVGPPQTFRGTPADTTAALQQMLQELSQSKAATRHRRIDRPRPSFSVAVLGIDGSGKSTLSSRVARALSANRSVCLITDTIEFYEHSQHKHVQPLAAEMVRQALARRARAAKSLKSYKIPKLAEMLLRDHLLGAVQRWYSPEVIVLDGSPLLNMAAWARIYKGEAFDAEVCAATVAIVTGNDEAPARNDTVYEKLPELRALVRLGLASMKLPRAAVLLDVDPTVSISRIEQRGKRRQAHETHDELSKLRAGYVMVCEVVQERFQLPVRMLDGRMTLEEVTDSTLQFIAEVEGHVEERTQSAH
ncbi:MAG: 1-acyl-sn-glycerol-3-phosphate acyltransferase [Planctomycetota bacterium]|jgi:1-acyl-sn-glycerol-3-phosphate acyltransferase